MATIVTGLVQGNDLSVLRTALREAGHQPDDLQVLSPEDAESQGSSGIAGGDRLSDTAATGTGVPGLTRTQGRRDYFSGSSINDRLGEFPTTRWKITPRRSTADDRSSPTSRVRTTSKRSKPLSAQPTS